MGVPGRLCPVEISNLTSRELLQTYAAILTELVDRGVTRSRNAPVGDVAEFLVGVAYDGKLAPPSEKSWDVLAADQRKIQVKSRLVIPGATGTQQYSPFRSWDFHVCVFLTFNAFTYDLLTALEVPAEGIRSVASPVPHVGSTAARVHTKTRLLELPGAIDVTALLQEVMDRLD
ncbi:MAG: DUF6998 domain-containing protein [Actinomycetes bacterium]